MINSDRAFDIERKVIKRIYDVFPFSAIEINEDYQEDIIEFKWKMFFKGKLLNHVESVRRDAFLHVCLGTKLESATHSGWIIHFL